MVMLGDIRAELKALKQECKQLGKDLVDKHERLEEYREENRELKKGLGKHEHDIRQLFTQSRQLVITPITLIIFSQFDHPNHSGICIYM